MPKSLLRKKGGKCLPRKCLACERTINTHFRRHAERCPNFTKWVHYDRTGAETQPQGK